MCPKQHKNETLCEIAAACILLLLSSHIVIKRTHAVEKWSVDDLGRNVSDTQSLIILMFILHSAIFKLEAINDCSLTV